MKPVKLSQRYFLYMGLGVFSLSLLLLILFLFFPYQRMLNIFFQEVFLGKHMHLSFVDVRKGLGRASASRILVGHQRVQGHPLFEYDRVQLLWNPFSIFKGAMDVYSYGESYGGTVRFSLKNIPLFLKNSTTLDVTLNNINLDKYPKGGLPWLKNVSGMLNGTLKRDVIYTAREKQKGSFVYTIKNGYLGQLNHKNSDDLSLNFIDLNLEGRIQGHVVILDKVIINGQNLTIRGSGIIEDGKITLNLIYESLAAESSLPGKGQITISGPVWLPEIKITQDLATQGNATTKK